MQREIASTGASYVTAVGTTVAGLALNEWMMVFGIIITFATFVVNAVYKHLHYTLQRDSAEKSKD
tara:strand:- start:825 stop:1019 length:195 start_codon:yes stop_codon:yes gene_type:complete